MIAIGHKILIAAYHILKDKIKYKELGAEYLDQLKKEKTKNYYVKRLNDMGYNIELKEAA